MMTRSCQLWGTLLLSITMLSFALGSKDCDSNKCNSRSENGGDHCYPLGNCSSGKYCCYMKCKGKECKQTCYTGVEFCKMDLECEGSDCDQTCDADECNLNCSGKNCKTQKCRGKVNVCEMDLECDGQDCEQTCEAKKCNLNCTGKNCKTQKCLDKGNVCEMDLECDGEDCEQTCEAKKCNLNCTGKNCRIQQCRDHGNVCEMDLECDGEDCEQTCEAKKCNLNCTGKNCKTQKCQGKGDVCEMHLECNSQDCEQICDAKVCNLTCSGRKCKTQSCTDEVQVCNTHFNANVCTQMCDGHSITSDSYTSNIVTSIGASTIRVFATKISTGHGTEAYTRLQSMSQSPLALISPLPSPSSHPPSAAILPAWTSTSTSALSPSSSKPVAASASASAASLEAISTAGASESSSALSPSSSKSKATSRLSSATSSEAASVAASASSPLLPSSFETSAAGSSSSPSLRTPLSSTLEIIKSLANDSVSKLKDEEISRIRALKEAVWIFEDFITRLQILQKPLAEEEFKIIRNSIFKVVVALEVFALNYGKHQMTGANSSVEINSRKLVLAIQKAYCKNASDFYLGKKELQTSLEVSSRNFANNVSVVVGIVYKDLHEVLITDQPNRTITGTTRYLDSGITAVALDPNPEKLQENIILRFRNLKIHEGEKKCMFWSGSSESLGGFSETGCHVVTSKSNSEETVCSCNHLTNFAVLLDYNGIPGLTVEDETIHEIITHVGLCLSIFGILLTIILYSYLTDVWQPLTQIRLSLSLSLGVGQIVFLAGINATENAALCVLIAAFLQYFLLAAFCWMLVEEIYFFLSVVKVYNISTKMHMYHFISWGLPIIMVSISMSIAAGKDGMKSYISETYCWLSSRNNLIWIFVTFVAIIEVLNILILVRIIKEMSTLTLPTGEDNHLQQIREVFKFNIY